MTIDQEIADFTAFARTLAEQQGSISLDEAYLKWRGTEPEEVAILRERLARYDAGERGRPAEEVMAELRQKLAAQPGS